VKDLDKFHQYVQAAEGIKVSQRERIKEKRGRRERGEEKRERERERGGRERGGEERGKRGERGKERGERREGINTINIGSRWAQATAMGRIHCHVHVAWWHGDVTHPRVGGWIQHSVRDWSQGRDYRYWKGRKEERRMSFFKSYLRFLWFLIFLILVEKTDVEKVQKVEKVEKAVEKEGVKAEETFMHENGICFMDLPVSVRYYSINLI
jgi:hypothetical protein